MTFATSVIISAAIKFPVSAFGLQDSLFRHGDCHSWRHYQVGIANNGSRASIVRNTLASLMQSIKDEEQPVFIVILEHVTWCCKVHKFLLYENLPGCLQVIFNKICGFPARGAFRENEVPNRIWKADITVTSNPIHSRILKILEMTTLPILP